MIKLDPINTNLESVFTDDEEGDAGSPTWALGDILQSLEEPDKSPLFYVSKANELVQLLQRHPLLKHELVLSVFGRRVQTLLLHPAKEVVAAGYRTARYAISNLESFKTIINLRTDALVVKSLAKDSKYNVEREQAIKFIRAYFNVPDGVTQLSLGVVCALVAVAEHVEDRLHVIALETLSELLIFDPHKVSAAGGIRILAETLANGPYELADSIATAFMYLLDKPDTRKYVWPGHDLDVVLSTFTELQEKDHIDEPKLKSCARVISVLLKSWSGLFYMCMYNFRSLRSLVECLRMPLPGLRDIMMDLLFNIFQIKSPAWSAPFLAGRRLTTFVANSADVSPKAFGSAKKRRKLTDQYASLLLAIFIEADLLLFLARIIEENMDVKNCRKATLLLSEIISLAAKILPQRYAIRTQVLGPLFSSAARFDTLDRFPASSAIFQIDKITKNLYRSRPDLDLRVRGEPHRESKRSEMKKMRLGLHLDDTYFRNLLLETNVLSTKNYTKWNWDTLIQLMQGPLLNPKRLDEAIRATKFMKRLMSFYRPFKYRFSEIRRTSASQRYVIAGSVLFKTLLANPEGVKYLMGNKLLRQVAECLAQLDPMSGITSAEPLFSKYRLETTLSYGYFTLLGTLSSDPNGLTMIERWRMFNMFYHLSELNTRKDLIMALVSSLDYHLEGHTRIILAKVLATGEKDVRMFTTSHLAKLIDFEDINMRNWAIELLVEQLYDVDPDVCKLAIKVLGDACEDGPTLDYIVQCLPDLEHLSDLTAPLLLRFLSTSEGFRFLQDLNYIEREMDEWFNCGNEAYVHVVELELARTFLIGDSMHQSHRSAPIPPHFYRELVRSREGIALLRQKDHVRHFTDFIKEHSQEKQDPDILRKLKACIWAVSNIGSLEFGVPFLEETNIVETIVDIANYSQVWSLKGTAFFALGLIASTAEGLEIADEYRWETAVSVIGEPLGLCLPADLGEFLIVPEWKSDGILRPSRRGVYVADSEAHLKQILIAQTENSSLDAA
ncbi:Rapamycin-insensitive companion of mTOR, N-term-domain-containing protein [Lipomyces chichibuensis]|uniref:Rapamycin-insensitive companion of mTOR, N-term-domain-containing protein n=1 Tax=Lipomyces chichibuensis TaxID=1546026 RepID=UPI003343882A